MASRLSPEYVYSKAYALQEAYNGIGSDGVTATMPHLIAGRSKAERERERERDANYLWKPEKQRECSYGIERKYRQGRHAGLCWEAGCCRSSRQRDSHS